MDGGKLRSHPRATGLSDALGNRDSRLVTPSGEVVEYLHRVPADDQLIDDVRADEPAAASDQEALRHA